MKDQTPLDPGVELPPPRVRPRRQLFMAIVDTGDAIEVEADFWEDDPHDTWAFPR